MINTHIFLIISLIPFTFTYNSTLVDLNKDCLYNDCIKIPKLYVNKEVDNDKPMNVILIAVIVLFAVSMVFAIYLTS